MRTEREMLVRIFILARRQQHSTTMTANLKIFKQSGSLILNTHYSHSNLSILKNLYWRGYFSLLNSIESFLTIQSSLSQSVCLKIQM